MQRFEARLGILERSSPPTTLESCDAALCRFLARTPPRALRAALPHFTDDEYAQTLAVIRVHVTGYGQEESCHAFN